MPHDVLLVEDNEADVGLVRAAFAALDADVTLRVAHRASEALGLARTRLPDLVLLDLNLPGEDGFFVLQGLRNDDATRLVPVVVLTSSDAPRDRARAYAGSANAYVVKPISYDELVTALAALVSFWFDVAVGPPAGGHSAVEARGP